MPPRSVPSPPATHTKLEARRLAPYARRAHGAALMQPALALLLACGPEPTSAPPEAAAPPTSRPVAAPPIAPRPVAAPPAASPPVLDPVAAPPIAAPPVLDPVALALAERAVHHDAFARPILYTWTTAEQAAELRTTRRLLVADADRGEPSPFIRALRELAATDPLAALLLDHPGLARRRYAWPAPFATVLGLRERRYGDVLIRIELAPDAQLLRFTPGAAAPFALYDMSGRPVDLPLADPARLAAVYHVRDGDDVPFREYVVVNETRIAAWSLSTPEIAAAVDADIALLQSLRTGPLGHLPNSAALAPAAPAWPTARERPTPLDRWHAALAFDNLKYRPTPRNLDAIVAALRARAGGAPLTVRPDMPFPPGPQGQQPPHAGR